MDNAPSANHREIPTWPQASNLRAVDSLEVLVLVDNVTDSLSTVPPGVANEQARLLKAGMKEMSGEAKCCAHHGLSLVIAARAGGETRFVMFDAGPEAYAMTRNGKLLGVPFGEIEAIALSHGHWDHAGGLVEAVRHVFQANGGKRIPMHMNEGMLARRGMTLPDGKSWEPDPWLRDERYLAVNVKDKGVVVFSMCSHAGVINVLTDARDTFEGLALHAVMGGFHLSGATVETIIPDTIRDLMSFGLKRIVPAHCTGWRAFTALSNACGDERMLMPSAVGRTFFF